MVIDDGPKQSSWFTCFLNPESLWGALSGLWTACAVLCLVAQSCLTLSTPWTEARQAPLSKGFSKQEHWSGLSCLPPGDLPNPGIEPRSPVLQIDSEPPGTAYQ